MSRDGKAAGAPCADEDGVMLELLRFFFRRPSFARGLMVGMYLVGRIV